MKISILTFGAASELLESNTTLKLEEGLTINDFKQHLRNAYPKLNNLKSFAIAINEEYASDNQIIKDGDTVAVIPPVSGG